MAGPFFRSPLPWVGILSGILYLLLYLPYPSRTHLVLITCLFSLFFYSVLVLRKRPGEFSPRNILAFAILFNVTLLKLPHFFSVDIHSYIAGAKIYTYYHENPFAVYPIQFKGDEMVYDAYPHYYAYGPVWLYISSLINSLAGPHNPAMNTLFFKTAAMLFNMLNSLLIYDILRRFNKPAASAGLLFYAWNPLVVIEAAGMGHNDVAMVCFLLLFVNFLVRGKESLATVFLSLAVLTKIPAAVALFPFAVFLIKKRSRGDLVKNGAIFALISAALYLPFWEGFKIFQGLQIHTEIFGRSPIAVVWVYASLAWGDDMGMLLTNIVQIPLILLFAHYLLKSSLSAVKVESLLSAIPRIYLVYLFAVVTGFWPWYLLWVVPFLALQEWGRIHEFTMLFCFTSMLAYFVHGYSIVIISHGIPLLYYIINRGLKRTEFI